jgi:hypothetical protein
MKTTLKQLAGLTALSLTLIAASPAGAENAAAATGPNVRAAAPAGVTFVALNRYVDSYFRLLHWTSLVPPYGSASYTLQGASGSVSSTPFDGSHALYSCFLTNSGILGQRDDFTSTDPNCEGQQRHPAGWGQSGYIASTQIVGTIALYRCLSTGSGLFDHFDTVHANCEGRPNTVNEFVLGYVFN